MSSRFGASDRRFGVHMTLPVTLWNPTALRLLLEAGVDGVRMIAKGVSPTEYKEAVELIWREAARWPSDRPFTLIVDLPGGRPRMAGDFWKRSLAAGAPLALVPSEVMESREPHGMTFPVQNLTADILGALHPGHRVVVGDIGEVELEVVLVHRDRIEARCLAVDGPLRATRSLSFPDSGVTYRSLSDADRQYVRALGDVRGLHAYLSMVSDPAEVTELRDLARGGFASVGAKIESRLGLRNTAAIGRAADRLVLARADLAIELAPVEMLNASSRLVRAARECRRPVTVASGLLTSLVHATSPTVSDVADFAYHAADPVDEFLLSGPICYEQPWHPVRWARRILDHIAAGAEVGEERLLAHV